MTPDRHAYPLVLAGLHEQPMDLESGVVRQRIEGADGAGVR